MKIFDLASMCVRNLTRRKFRTFLTVSGVVIGTTSIVIMISLGVGISKAQEEMFKGFGDLAIINIYSRGSSTESTLNDAAVEGFQQIPGVLVATPFMEYRPRNSWMQLFAGRKNRYENGYSVVGVKPQALQLMGYTVNQGRFLGESPSSKKISLIAGKHFVYAFSDTKKRWPNNQINIWEVKGDELPEPFFEPLSGEYRFVIQPSKTGAKPVEFEAEMVGIIASGDYSYDEKNQQCFMDIADMKAIRAAYEKENGIRKTKGEIEQYETVKVKTSDVNLVSEVQKQIEDQGFLCDSMQQYRDQMQESTQQIQLILAILGGVSLLVASISITNTMIMSVYERTREIGVMKVLGCLVSNIRTIFLMEAGLIGLFGGCVGVGVSYLLSYAFNTFGSSFAAGLGLAAGEGSKLSIIPLWLALTGLGVATCIGLAAGFYPANRAVRISALEAIKQE